jgi:hypothetical protein
MKSRPAASGAAKAITRKRLFSAHNDRHIVADDQITPLTGATTVALITMR